MMRTIISVIVWTALVFTACRSDGILINVNFRDVSGVERGDRVLFQSNTAGQVGAVKFNQDGSYTIQLQLKEGFANAVTEYSRFYVIGDPQRQGRKGIEIKLVQQGGTQLASGTTVNGESPENVLADTLQSGLNAGIGFIQEQVEKFGQDLRDFRASPKYEKLLKSLEEFADEMERKEKQTREKMKETWLPQLQRELKALKERLKKMGREDELAPLEQKVDRLRSI